MAKMLILDFEKCSGCRLCEAACSVKHTDTSNPARANIHVVKWDEDGFFFPVKCQHCEVAACMAVCPQKAIYKDIELGRVAIDYDLCIGCKSCIIACPFGALKFDEDCKKIIKCDLCDGDPICVKFCPMGAMEYVDFNTVNYEKMRNAARMFSDLLKKVNGEDDTMEDIVLGEHKHI